MHDAWPSPHGDGDAIHKLGIRHDLRAGRVDDAVLSLACGPGRDLCHVFACDWLNPIAPPFGNHEDRHVPQQPGDVVDEDVARTEYESRSDHGPLQPGFANQVLGARLACVVVEVRIDGWVAYADVHDLPDPGFGRGRYKDPGVGHRVAKTDAAVMEPHPVGVVEDIRAAKTFYERRAVGEL